MVRNWCHMSRWIRLAKHASERAERVVQMGEGPVTEYQAVTLLGAEILVLVLKSDDLLLVRSDFDDQSYPVNEYASLLAKCEIRGDAILTSPEDYKG